jgi:hypothetical protein
MKVLINNFGTFNRTGSDDNQRRIKDEDRRIQLAIFCAKERRTPVVRQIDESLQDYLASLRD